jgi:hypothetical protein
MRYLSSSSAQIIFLFASLFFSNQAWAQVAISTQSSTTTPDPTAVLLLVGDGSQGLIIPIVTNKSAASQKKGMVVFDDSDKNVYFNNGSGWIEVGGGSGSGVKGIRIQGNVVTVDNTSPASFSLAQTAPTVNGQLLMWDATLNSTAGGWTSSKNTAPVNGQVLKWNGTSWEPGADNAGSTPSLANNQIFVGNASNVATGVLMSQDATINNTGALTIATGAINSTKILDGTIVDADVSTTAAIAGSKIDPTFTANLVAPSLKITGSGTSINGQAYTWPTVAPLANTFLKSDATGNLSWASSGGGGFSTFNTIPKGDGSTLVASTITDDGTTVEITGTSPKLSLRSTSGSSTSAASSLEFTNAINGLIGSISDTGSSDHLQISSFQQGLLFNTNFNTRMAIDNNGNVGIGTISPISKLDVSGDVRLAPTTAPALTTEKLYNVSGNLFWNGTNISSGGSGWGLSGNSLSGTEFIGSTNAQPLKFTTGAGGIERMRITSTGGVGIGTTAPNGILEVSWDAANNINPIAIVSTTGANSAAAIAYVNTVSNNSRATGVTSSGDFKISGLNANIDLAGDDLTITPAGNVGIGTNSPLNTLHVQSTLTGTDLTTLPVARFANNTLNGNTKVILGSDNTTADGFSNFTSGSTTATQVLGFGVGNATSTTAQLNITGTSQVGINTATPDSDATLHVLGFASKIRSEGFAATLSLVANPFFSGSTHDFSIASSSAGTLTFTDNGATRMQITSTGGVSINGALSKGSGTFKIDHPQDPENKFLYHSFVESPDMMNVYNGNITTNAQGDAVVSLPTYFEALNKDFRYQLTVIGTFAQAIVMKEVEANQFTIKTDKPNVKVSWQVTGVRKDPFAEKNRVVPEVDKSNSEKGKYLHPEAYNLPIEKGINFEQTKENN